MYWFYLPLIHLQHAKASLLNTAEIVLEPIVCPSVQAFGSQQLERVVCRCRTFPSLAFVCAKDCR